MAKNKNLLDQVRVFLHNEIIAKIKDFRNWNMVVDIRPQTDNNSKLIKTLSLPFFPVTPAELNEFGLKIDQENMLYWHAIFSINTVYTVSNTLAAPSIQKTLKLGNNLPVTPISNPKKQAYAACNSSFNFYFFFFHAL